VIAAAVLSAISPALHGRSARYLGVVLGAILGIPVALISHRVNQSASTLPAISALWILASCLTRSGLLGWIDQRLKASAIAETTSGTVGYVTRIDRRRFLIRIGGASAVVTVAGASIGMFSDSVRRRTVLAAGDCWSSANSLPNADAAVAPEPRTRTEYTPLERHYRIDINTSPPRINGEKWRLKIDGLVETPITLTLDELRRHPGGSYRAKLNTPTRSPNEAFPNTKFQDGLG
jgi:hypothetical protein